LFDLAGVAWRPASPGDAIGATPIRAVVEDSREAVPGCLFIARPGTKTDGARFIADAVDRGAVAVALPDCAEPIAGIPTVHLADIGTDTARLAEAVHGWPSRELDLFGVTGTNGKTTTAFLVQQLLGAAGIRAGLISTVVIDDGRESRPSKLTTPFSVELSSSLARMRDNGCRAAAMEVSSHALDQGRASALRFRVAAFTNLTGDHLDYHGTLDRYADAKARLFDGLDPDALAIVNADDPAHARMVRDCRARIVRITLGGAGAATADVRARIIESSIRGTRAEIIGPWGTLDVRTTLIGAHNLWNLSMALCAGIELGVPAGRCAALIPHMGAPPGRLEPVTIAGADPGFAVFVDYAHTDDALTRVLASVRPLVAGTGGCIRVLFGCGGDRDRTKRPRMAAAACAGADAVVLTSDNPRTEDPQAILRDALAGVPDADRGRVAVDADRRAAIGMIIADARPGDVVVIAGKGHENYQLLPDGKGGIIRRDFDDRAVAAEALASR
jgi:UDP-N-acetylmuramoyl-L-alanyl-D-glutamate--2,6-diaminopimelate ligase